MTIDPHEDRYKIVVRNAREHNLKSVSLSIPRDRLVVITGPSGSGKSSLAFDTIYAEGQRRYVESLSVYARQFLDRLPKPDVESIDGLSPAIAIEQQSVSRNPRSTVGTTTEIYDYLRVLFARVGVPTCPECGQSIGALTVQQMVDRIMAAPEGTRFLVLAPVVRGGRGSFRKLCDELRRTGFVRIRLDGEVRELHDLPSLDAKKEHFIDVVVDRLSVRESSRQRLSEAIELALARTDGLVRIAWVDGDEEILSERFACLDCNVSLPEVTPRLFSFNSPDGACPACGGLGYAQTFAEERVIPDPHRSIAEGAIAPWGKPKSAYGRHMIEELTKGVSLDLEEPFCDLPSSTRHAILHGDDSFEGVLPGLTRRVHEYERRRREEGANEQATFDYLEEELGPYSVRTECRECQGTRLRREARAVRIEGNSISDLCARPAREAEHFFNALSLTGEAREIGGHLLSEIQARLSFLVAVGLDYISLSRASGTLSGGEAQRIRLATQIGSKLSGVLYVLDEPSVGLHPRDNGRLIETLLALRDRGNTVLVVEHDLSTIRAADYLVDLGPGAGQMGGHIIASGSPAEVANHETSSTGAYLSGRRSIPVPATRRRSTASLFVKGASLHNLKNIDVDIPLRVWTCVTGVSGSGKSSLISDTLLPTLRKRLMGAATDEVAVIEGVEKIDKVIAIDQAPIGRTPRSNPATYTGLFAELRTLFSGLPESRARGYKAGRFSFNVKGGRCESCQGAGVMRVSMHFLPDVFVRCESCEGRRYNRETLEVTYRGYSIAEVLQMSVEQVIDVLSAIPPIARRLDALKRVGLGYLELGRNATTLSGGEAQRLKLARELARQATGRTLYVLDEPTTGLHFVDVEALVPILRELVDGGNSVIVIEHNLDVIKNADHVIDLGPEGGAGGGEIVATGTPEEIARCERSHTGRFLREVL